MKSIKSPVLDFDLTKESEHLIGLTGKTSFIRVISKAGCRCDSIIITKPNGDVHTFNIMNEHFTGRESVIDIPIALPFEKGDKLRLKTISPNDIASRIILFIAERVS